MKKQVGALLALFTGLMFAVSPALAARVDHTPDAPVNVYTSISAGAAKMNFAAADATNFEQVTLTGREVVYAWNTSADTPYTVTFTSVADSFGRTGDITTYNIPFGEIHRFGPFPANGWAQSNGKLYFKASNVAVKFAIVRER